MCARRRGSNGSASKPAVRPPDAPHEPPGLARRINLAGVAALFVVLLSALAFIRPIADPDTFWMLAAGKVVLGGKIPYSNTLSEVFGEYPWQFTQWLSGALFALAEKAGGLNAVIILTALVGASIFALTFLTGYRRGERFSPWTYLPFFILALVETRYRITPRGDIFTVLGLALIPLLWSARPRKLWLWAGGLGAVWVNLHSGAVFGVAVWALAALSALIGKDRGAAKEAGLACAAFFVGTLANPYLIYPYEYIYVNSQILKSFPLPIDELARPDFKGYPAFFGYFALSLPALVFGIVRRDWFFALSYLMFCAMALTAVRFIPYFTVGTLAGVSVNTFGLFRLIAEKVVKRRSVQIGGAASFAIALAALAAYGAYGKGNEYGLGVVPRKFPAGGCDYVARVNPPGRLFNEFDQGGYVAWRLYPRKGVFVDGRGTAYPMEHFRETLAYKGDAVSRLVDKYGLDVAIVQRRTAGGGGPDLGQVFDRLGWKLVYMEGLSYVFVRPGSRAEAATFNDVFTAVLPWEPINFALDKARQNPFAAQRELRRIDPALLAGAAEFHRFAVLSFVAGVPDLSERFLAAGLGIFPGHPQLRLDYATILQRRGNAEAARIEFEAIIRERPDSTEAAEARKSLGGR